MSDALARESRVEVDYTGGCEVCGSVQKIYKINSTQEDGFVIHTQRCYLTGSSRKEKDEKKKCRQRIENIVSALRNTSGGILIVHIQGQRPGDKYLEFFDEFISDSLHHLTDHGHLYINTYKRHWLDEIPAFRDFQDFVLLKVSKSQGISTVDFNTKIRSDHEIKSPLVCNVFNILSESKPSQSDTSKSQSQSVTSKSYADKSQSQDKAFDIQALQENRNVECKAFKPPRPLADVPALVSYLWEDLKLKYNIAALSKVADGGCYYVGISENSQKGQYVTKTLALDGFQIDFDINDLQLELREKVSNSTIAYKTGSGFVDTPSDLVDIYFQEVPNTNPRRHILRVFVKYFEGVIFTERKGPRTYKIDKDKSIKRMSKEEWLDRFNKSAD